MPKQFFTIRNLLIIFSVFVVVAMCMYFLKINLSLLEETKRNNTFQRRLNFENSLIERELACQEMGKLSDPQVDYYFDNNLKRCSIEIKTDKIEIPNIEDGKYRGLWTDNLIKDYNFYFSDFYFQNK